MFYRVSQKERLSIKNRIFLNALPILEEQGFEKSPFPTDWFGRYDSRLFVYSLARLSDSYLELITTDIFKGDRWIQVHLNIFELSPTPKTLSELNKIDGIPFHLPPDNRTNMRLDVDLFSRNFFKSIFGIHEYRLKSFFTHSGLLRRQRKLENLLKRDFKNIDRIIEMWHKIHKPMKTDWEGKPISETP